jgi:hypothetical protein
MGIAYAPALVFDFAEVGTCGRGWAARLRFAGTRFIRDESLAVEEMTIVQGDGLSNVLDLFVSRRLLGGNSLTGLLMR